jgi:starch-binding outer membrane protein, SusD/RagB family
MNIKLRNSLGGVALAALSLTACNDDFVDTTPLSEVPEETVWADASLTEAYVTEIYAGLGNGGFDEQMLASLTDETIFTHPGRNITTITESRSNPAEPGWINAPIQWDDLYLRIRAANLALEKLATPQFDNPALADRLKGEARFMRGYYYHQLVRYYGAVPLVARTYSLGEEDYLVARNTMEECINFIVQDADEAARLLDGKAMAAGRASKAAALALKSRILLYAASDLYDVNTAKATSPLRASYAHPELMGYVTGSRPERWQRARDAAKAVLDLPGYGYKLDLTAPETPQDARTNYLNTSLSRNGGERELLFARYFTNLKQENGGRQGLFNGPNGYQNWAGNTPIQHLVDDYAMMDGTPFNWNNPAHAEAPYQNREPRFYSTFLYDGALWKPRTAAGAAADPANEIQTGSYEVIRSGAKVIHFGLDTRKSPIEDWNGSYTGYYMRKFTDPDPAIVDQNTWQEVPWPFFRYTEAVLNYVEACIELGQDNEARAWLNKVRFRAGLPAVTESGDALRQRYRNERRVEMVFEEQRYHDARRWMIAPGTLGRQANGISIFGALRSGKEVSIYKYNPESYDYNYTVINIDPGKENRRWDDKMYFLPIHRDEINRNKNLVQNPGY